MGEKERKEERAGVREKGREGRKKKVREKELEKRRRGERRGGWKKRERKTKTRREEYGREGRKEYLTVLFDKLDCVFGYSIANKETKCLKLTVS